MKPRIFVPLLGAGALLIGTGIAVQVASADERSQVTAEYTEAGFWNGGLIGTFTIRNPAAEAESWKLTFDMSDGATVAGIWNGRLSATSLGSYTITPQTSPLAAGGVTTVGFTASTKAHAKPVNCHINGTDCKITVRSAATAGTSVSAPAPSSSPSAPSTPSAKGTTTTAPGNPPAAKKKAPVTGVTPYVKLPSTDRPPLTSIAKGGDAKALTLTSVTPGQLDTYSKEVSEALDAGIALVASVDGSNVSEPDLQKVLAHGIRNLDIPVPADKTLSRRWAELVKQLEARYPDLSVGYTLPGTDTSPLTAAKQAGAVIDRVNVIPQASLLSGLGLADTVQPLLDAARQVHGKLMSIEGIDSAGAWRMLGIVPVLGGRDLLGQTQLQPSVTKLVDFVKGNGVGLVGVMPAGDSLGAGILPQIFALTDALK
jgi:hypothetical protein